METVIKKQITLLDNRVTTVNYVQGTDVIPIEFEIMDYKLPTDTEARLYVHKPSTAIIYNFEKISGQKITITPTTQMFAEVGKNYGNIEIVGKTDMKKIATFPILFMVAPNFRDEGALESKDEYEALIYYMTLAKSWAIGGTKIRDGEDTNNSKYWSTWSESWAKGGTGKRTGEGTNNANYWSRWAESWAQGATKLRTGEDTNNAQWWSVQSNSYAKGGTGKRTGEATDNASYYNTQSKSWAVGGTGERAGEDTNNSQWYQIQSHSYSSGGTGKRTGEDKDNSKWYMTQSRSYSSGDTNTRTGETTDNSKYYMTQSHSYAKGGTGARDGEATDNASYYNTQSKSWAQGGTNARTGEGTNNSKYWSGQSQSYAKGGTGARTGEATDNAAYYRTQSQSWAVGGTKARDGEDTDNSKYYSQQSANSATASANSATASANSATASADSATASKNSATASANSATAAKTSEKNAKTSEANASKSASAASTSATNAANSAKTATDKATAASSSATSAANSATAAANSASAAKTSETNAAASADLAAARAVGALKPVGTIKFSQLPTSGQAIGDMYNVSDAFTTTASFEEGAGKAIPAGSNIYWTKNSKWDVLSGVNVIGVKGSAESAYRTGNVNLTAANVGASPTDHKHSTSDITSGVFDVSRLPSDAVFRTSPTHSVPNNADLNDSTYLVVGNYYSPLATLKFTNSGLQGAWMMVVLAPLGGETNPRTKEQIDAAKWVYRLRYQFNSTGIYAQAVRSGDTAGKYSYGAWRKITVPDGNASAGDTDTPVYFKDGKPVECTDIEGGTEYTTDDVTISADDTVATLLSKIGMASVTLSANYWYRPDKQAVGSYAILSLRCTNGDVANRDFILRPEMFYIQNDTYYVVYKGLVGLEYGAPGRYMEVFISVSGKSSSSATEDKNNVIVFQTFQNGNYSTTTLEKPTSSILVFRGSDKTTVRDMFKQLLLNFTVGLGDFSDINRSTEHKRFTISFSVVTGEFH